MLGENNENLNLNENIDIISFDSTNNINRIMEDSFSIIQFNQFDFFAGNSKEISEEISSFKDGFKREKNKQNQKIFFKKLKGRKRKREKKDGVYKYGYIHDKFSTDNILRKVQVHYLSFIVQYSNAVLLKLGIDDLFIKIDYKLKLTVNKKYVTFIKNLTIGEILCWNTSPKYRTKGKDYNKNIYFKAKQKPIIEKIFGEKYLSLFRNVYYKNKRAINLDIYGTNDSIILSKKRVKMFEEFLEKNEIKVDDKDNEYLKKIKNCIIKNFLSI